MRIFRKLRFDIYFLIITVQARHQSEVEVAKLLAELAEQENRILLLNLALSDAKEALRGTETKLEDAILVQGREQTNISKQISELQLSNSSLQQQVFTFYLSKVICGYDCFA